jgi:hypothetical protein
MSGMAAGLVRKLDFGDSATTVTGTARGRAGLRLAAAGGEMAGPGKYRVLAHRRRLAQMHARHVLDRLDAPPVAAWRDPVTGGGRLVREVR